MNANTFLPNEQHIMRLRPQPSANAPGAVVLSTAVRVAPAVAQPFQQNEQLCPDSCRLGSTHGTMLEMSGAFDQPDQVLRRKAIETQIHQNYLGVEKNSHCQAGANRFVAYLEGQQRSLAEVTKWDLQEWACTPIAKGKGKGTLPSERVFRGAKRLCAFAAQVGYIEASRANTIAECKRQHLDANELRRLLLNPVLTEEERASRIHLHYQMAEENANRQAGARSFLGYLQSQKKSLAEVSTSDLGRWALMLNPRGHLISNLPNSDAFEGAKGLCVLAAEVGYSQAQSAREFAAYTRPPCDLESLHNVLQNPDLTRREHENHIRLYFHSFAKQHDHQAGAKAILLYLESQGKSLAEVSASDLEQWALTPVTTRTRKFNVPSPRAFEGAKLLCALAGEVGYIDLQRAKDLAELKRPQFGVETLRTLLQNPALTHKERESHIRLTYQSSENNTNRQTGAVSFLAYLEDATIALSEVSSTDLRQWALTPMRGTRNLPQSQAFEGAKALCLLAVEVGHIDAQRAQELAACTRPHFHVDLLRLLLQNPDLTRKEREYHLNLHYQSLEKDPARQGGASGIMEYLEKQGSSLSEVTTSDLEQWALTPIASGKGKSRLPNPSAFLGAQALCALAAEVGYIDAQRGQNLARCSRPQGDLGFLRLLIQNPELTGKERDHHIYVQYQSAEKNIKRQAGATGFLAHLESQDMSLAEASKSDLEGWALTPMAIANGKKNVPNAPAFEGAKALCALAAEVGHIDASQAHDLATCARPRFDVDFLRMVLQNSSLTSKEREAQIRLNYQSSEKNRRCLTGADAFLAYLEVQESSLAEVTKSALEGWALTPLDTVQSKGTFPSRSAFKGAKGLCAVAAEVDYIDAQTAKDIAECLRPHFDSDALRSILENPALTRKERDSEIGLNYQSTEKSPDRQSGMNGFLAYLENRGRSLADVTKRDLQQWVSTPIPAGQSKGTCPSLRVIQGAKGLCALAAEVGYIDAQRAADIVKCTFPQPGEASIGTVRPSEASQPASESSSATLERANKRLRTDDQGASTSMSYSLAFPQSDALFRELALSPPTLLEPNQPAHLPQTRSPQTLIDELESLEDMLGFSEHRY